MEQRKAANHQKDYELFLQDLEEDPEYRAHVNLFKEESQNEEKKLEDKVAEL